MKKKIYIIILICSLGFTLSAQELTNSHAVQRNTISVGFGFFNDIFIFKGVKDIFTNGGKTVWAQGGRRLSSGYNINITIAQAHIHYPLDERWGVFEGEDNNEYFGLWGIGISKPFNLKGQHSIEPSLGLIYRQWSRLSPRLWYENGVQQLSLGTGMWHDLGLSFSVAYQYTFQNDFYMGAMVGSYYIWAIGIEGLTLSPVFGVRF